MKSSTFCVAPWLQACVNPDGKLTPCCLWDAPSQYSFNQFDQWISSTEMQNVRESLDNGEQILPCNRCWSAERIKRRSLRQIYNEEFFNYFTGAINTVTFDFKLGNLCNLKCVMCSGDTSSQLLTEYKTNQSKFDNILGYRPPPLDIDFEWPLKPEFKDFLNRFKDQARWIKFTGGEPTMIPYVISLLNEIPNPELVTVSLVTNATRINNELLSILSRFGAVWINASIEGIGKDNEQIRYLSKWSEVEHNILSLNKLNNVYFSISYVLQCFSVQTFIPVLKWCEQHNLKLDSQLLSGPNYLSMASVDPDIIENFRQKLQELQLKNNQNVVEQAIEFLKAYKFDPALKKQRLQYLSTLDNIRGTDLKNLINREKNESSTI